MRDKILNSLLILAVVVAGFITWYVKDDNTNVGSDNSNNTSVGDHAADIPPQPDTATYMITFDATWSTESHPSTLPPGAHVSPAVAVAHSTPNDLFESRAQATPGIEDMAETGATPVLLAELAADPSVLESKVGARIDTPGKTEITITASKAFPLLSIVSMLAPSPDWFVGINNFNLFEDGVWLESAVLETAPYDAGTDSGVDFTSENSDTQPKGVISTPQDAAFVEATNQSIFGTITVVRL